MSKPRILVFAPREEPPETIAALEGTGCELVFCNRDWQLPRLAHEDAVVESARDAVGLMGTSMRHTPISGRLMRASQRVLTVPTYPFGATPLQPHPTTDLGGLVS